MPGYEGQFALVSSLTGIDNERQAIILLRRKNNARGTKTNSETKEVALHHFTSYRVLQDEAPYDPPLQ